MIIKLLTFFLIIYLLIKFSKFITKTLFYMVVEKPPQKVNQERRRPSDGNVNIDYVPNDKNSRGNKPTDGEYVEYEEVK